MKSYQRTHLADQTIAQYLAHRNARLCDEMADHLADLGEFDFRRLYLGAGYPSMYQYCLHELHLCEQAAFKRIYVARRARRFPSIFRAIAEGRLHLSAVVMVGTHLTEATAAELLTAVEHKTKAQIERLLADRFPQPDLPAVIEPISPPRTAPAVSAATALPAIELSPGKVQVETPSFPLPPRIEPARVTPVFAGHSRMHVTIDQETEDHLRYAQALLGRATPPGDLTAVLKRLVEEGIRSLEKRKLGAGDASRAGTRQSAGEGRYVPTEVRRVVWERDGGRCAFVSPGGARCPERLGLQFDHIEPYARGGAATVANLRLLCRAHNHYEAEQTYGAEFMRHKRLAAAETRAAARGARPRGPACVLTARPDPR